MGDMLALQNEARDLNQQLGAARAGVKDVGSVKEGVRCVVALHKTGGGAGAWVAWGFDPEPHLQRRKRARGVLPRIGGDNLVD